MPRKKNVFKHFACFFFLFPFCTSIDTIAVNQHVKDGDFIVSKENNFELGFFSPGNSSSRYVGIWYADKSEKAVVWVANRNNPINDTSGVLTINRYGKLVLYAHNTENLSIWSTNVSVQTTSTCVAQLLDTGNLVLLQDSKSESSIWQSFDYPTDTLLPGMKVGFNWKIGLEWVLTSWKSQNDPGTGNYSLRLSSNQTATVQSFLYKGLTKYWRSDPGPWPNFVSNNEEMYYFLLTDNTSVIRVLLTDYGILQHLRWKDAVNQWEELLAVPKYRCDDMDSVVPTANVALTILMSLNVSAYRGMNQNLRIIGTGEMGQTVHTELGRDLYVRVDKMELAENTRKSKGFLKSRGLLAIPMAAVALVLIIGFACWWLKKKRKMKDFVEADELEDTSTHPEMQFFHLSAIIVATDNFSPVNKLGQGGFGTVYKGQLANDQKIAVKRLAKTSGQGIEEFKNEVTLIARLQHRNLVKLLGCCIKGEERMLVLEYLPNKSLDSFLFDHTKRSLLDWKKRFEIINGVARGILYLHQDSRLRIIHRDLKTSNVLLDSEMNPKISDFGMARIFHGDQLQDTTNRVVGTYGYMPPEYVVFGRYSTKSDVFSFGIILLEIVSGKKNNGPFQEDHSINLIGHVWQLWREDRALEIVDSSLESYHSDEVMRCIQVGLLCLQEDSEDRPTMSAVVFMLSGEASLPSPQQPAFVFRKSSHVHLYSLNDLTITEVEAR
ncbi:uncharacterized protein Pyn_31292 [Prunus yedoensis var. nudiflora]|uniref:Receptor-like serine/threonine-protein kinase n=1 Tax=Prunus yedoensis var. nudiflora TaxID=2094558 RepID=A0A314UA43_PRUYE|nr:uncharacterized protein Pyn_31292 [Prunus yedoensis var. nudiflora]